MKTCGIKMSKRNAVIETHKPCDPSDLLFFVRQVFHNLKLSISRNMKGLAN